MQNKNQGFHLTHPYIFHFMRQSKNYIQCYNPITPPGTLLQTSAYLVHTVNFSYFNYS